jgi:hypothetical protein
MKKQLLIALKINAKPLALSFLAGILLLPGFAFAQGLSVSFGVEFGTPQSNGGPCVGKGSCEQVFDFNTSTGVYVSEPGAITVTFTVIPPAPVVAPVSVNDTVTTALATVDSIIPLAAPVTGTNSNVITMSFSLSELTAKQPGQVTYFTDTSHTYQFETSTSLTTPIFASLGLLPDASIEPTDVTHVAITGDHVVVTIYYSHSGGKTAPNTSITTQANNTTLSPNPATDKLLLHVNADDKISSYRITNLVGQVVNESVMSGTSKSIDVSTLPSGMYLVNLFSGNTKTETVKFVKQ